MTLVTFLSRVYHLEYKFWVFFSWRWSSFSKLWYHVKKNRQSGVWLLLGFLVTDIIVTFRLYGSSTGPLTHYTGAVWPWKPYHEASSRVTCLNTWWLGSVISPSLSLCGWVAVVPTCFHCLDWLIMNYLVIIVVSYYSTWIDAMYVIMVVFTCSYRAVVGCGLWLICRGGVEQWVQWTVPGEAGGHSCYASH